MNEKEEEEEDNNEENDNNNNTKQDDEQQKVAEHITCNEQMKGHESRGKRQQQFFQEAWQVFWQKFA